MSVTKEDKLVKKMIRQKENALNKYTRFNEAYFRKIYFVKKRKGDRSVVVDEWDIFEKEMVEQRIKKAMEYKNKNKMEDLSDMSKRKVEVRLSKAYNVASVEVSEIDTVEEFYAEREWARLECETIINSLPDDGYKSVVKKTPQQATQSFQAEGHIPSQSTTPSFGSEKQWKLVKDSRNTQKILNAGINPNEIRDYATLQTAIKAIFA